jgi:GntR family transcriptional regulator
LTAVRELHRGAAPAYRQIAQLLRSRIIGGKYTDRLPTDDELMQEFEVGRHTVRAAVAKLVDEGLVERFPGRGTFILPADRRASPWGIRSLEDILDQRFTERPKIVGAKFLAATHDLAASEALQIDATDEMLCILALRTLHNLPYSCSQIFLPGEIGRVLIDRLPHHVASTPMIHAIEQECHFVVARAVQTASATLAPKEVATLLDVEPKAGVLLLARTYFTAEDRPLEHARMFGHPDRYRHTIEFTRSRENS